MFTIWQLISFSSEDPHQATVQKHGCTRNQVPRGDLPLPYLLIPWSRVLLEKLTGSQLVKKFPAFYGTRRFITAITSARYLSLSWASSIQSIPPHPTSCRPISISPKQPQKQHTALSYHLCFHLWTEQQQSALHHRHYILTGCSTNSLV